MFSRLPAELCIFRVYNSRYNSKNRTGFRGGGVASKVQDGTAFFIIRDSRCKYRTGQIVTIWGTPAEYDYLLLCDGSQISAKLYPELVAVLGGNTLPNLVGRFLEGAGSAGTYKSAGLPNINAELAVANVGRYSHKENYSKGALAYSQGVASGAAYTSGTTSVTITFDASKSTSIYGSSATVQPNSMTVKYYICYAG